MLNMMITEDSHLQKQLSVQKEYKIAILREEFMALSHDPLVAILLGQFVYWSKRVRDFDSFLKEERDSLFEESQTPHHGWFYKTLQELIDETMVNVTTTTLRKYLRFLEKKGWITSRISPSNKWDRTTQWRVNIRKLSFDLQNLGYDLCGYEGIQFSDSCFPSHKANKSTDVKNESSIERFKAFDAINAFPSNKKPTISRIDKKFGCNTETTTKTTNKEYTSRTKNDLNSFLDLWTTHIGQPINLTKPRQQKFESLLSQCFEDDFAKWIQFCEQIQSSPFLMGKGTQKWRITFDWVLNPENTLKVLEGNFDDSEILIKKQQKSQKINRFEEIENLLSSIADPRWQHWCRDLHQGNPYQDPLSFYDVQSLSSSKFLEFDGRLIWIECPTKNTLDCIEKLKFRLLYTIQKTFPLARDIRAQLSKKNQ